MADKKVSELTSLSSASGDDLILIINDPAGSPTSRKITVADFFSEVDAAATFNTRVTITGNTSIRGEVSNITANVIFQGDCRIPSPTSVSSNNATTEGVGVGSIFFDSDYLYIAVDSTTIKRVALSTF